MPAWPWSDAQVSYYASKARRAMRRHERGEELCRASLIWLALEFWRQPGREPVRDLKAWARGVSLPQLREWITGFDAPELRWIEDMLGFPPFSQGFGDRSR